MNPSEIPALAARSGLEHIWRKVEASERLSGDDLKRMGKGFYSEDLSRKCCHMLRRKYPSVFVQGTFIVGMRTSERRRRHRTALLQ